MSHREQRNNTSTLNQYLFHKCFSCNSEEDFCLTVEIHNFIEMIKRTLSPIVISTRASIQAHVQMILSMMQLTFSIRDYSTDAVNIIVQTALKALCINILIFSRILKERYRSLNNLVELAVKQVPTISTQHIAPTWLSL